MTAHRVRPMHQWDLESVLTVEVGAYSHPWSRRNFEDSLRTGDIAWVVEETQVRASGSPEIVPPASIVAYLIAMPGVQEMHLLNLTVAARGRRQGLARELLHRLVDRSVREGCLKMWLEVRASNAAARALYESEGFSRLGLRRGYYPAANGREDAIVMARDLPVPEGVATPAANDEAHETHATHATQEIAMGLTADPPSVRPRQVEASR